MATKKVTLDVHGMTCAACAMTVEKTHFDLYSAALAAAKAGQDIAAKTFYVCPVCGHTVADAHPEKCPVCGSLKWDEVA